MEAAAVTLYFWISAESSFRAVLVLRAWEEQKPARGELPADERRCEAGRSWP